MSMKKSSSIFLLILLLLSIRFEEEERSSSSSIMMMMVVEARTCESQSHGFKGRCVSHNNCGLVCRNEGFTGGTCRGARGRCFCTKNC
ncbi:hypothetical protein SSX86_032993 [Deinandra increscens subsp. villosa]|uniref:Knottins-like domain-containing protein n=1 Tax=Deinandra increscens subsp. villosa TaxID=3103831 RepID=A0AAP0GG92_9ASTR